MTAAETANENLKHDAQTQHDDMQAMPVLYMTQLEATSQQYYVSWDGGAEVPSLWPPNVSAEALAKQYAAL